MTLQIYYYSLCLAYQEKTRDDQRMRIVLLCFMYALFDVSPFYIESTFMTLLLQGIFSLPV